MNKKVFAHDKQIKMLKTRAKHRTFHGGRGSGKTNLIGMIVGLIFNRMPRSRWVLVGRTYTQLDIIVLPEIVHSLEQMGIYQYNAKTMPYGHYVIGVKPPDHWDKPFKKVGRLGYQYCLTAINGFTLQFVSEDRSDSSRGMNTDGAITDERATIKTDFLNKVVYPTVRANTDTFLAKDSLHLGHFEFSSAAWTAEGMEMYKMEEQYNDMLRQRKLMSREELELIPPKYCWVEGTCLDNPYTGVDYYNNMKETLDPLEFDVEVANMRLQQKPNGFYYGFSTAKHSYLPKDCYQYDDEKGLHLYLPNDYRTDKPLEVSLDFNAAICWTIVCQEVGKEFRVINSNYIKPSLAKADTSIVTQGALWLADKYESHPDKTIWLYGDPNGNSKSAASSNENLPFLDEYTKVLVSKGFKVIRKELKSYPRHIDKYKLANLLFGEDSTNMPRIRINSNSGKNKALMIALQSTETLQKTHFEKNKNSESSARNREYATDSTDALDYIIWEKYKRFLPNTTQKNHVASR